MTTKLYQLIATGSSAVFSGTKTIGSRQLYTARPTAGVVEKFKQACTRYEPPSIDWIDPETVSVKVVELELVDGDGSDD